MSKRATPVESTRRGKRATIAERTTNLERAKQGESTRRNERANLVEETKQYERAAAAESTTDEKRASVGESTSQQERATIADSTIARERTLTPFAAATTSAEDATRRRADIGLSAASHLLPGAIIQAAIAARQRIAHTGVGGLDERGQIAAAQRPRARGWIEEMGSDGVADRVQPMRAGMD